jgi:class 3 adenylate cyclase
MVCNRPEADTPALVRNTRNDIWSWTRKSDEDLASEFHQGQQASDLREQAGYKTVTFLSTDVKKSLELQEAPI